MHLTMQEIIPGVYLGPYSVALENSRSLLLRNGVTHIVCVRQDMEAHYIKPQFKDQFTYLTLDIADMETENIIRFFPEVRQFIDSALENNAKVLVHSNNGNSRSATLILAYIMEKHSLTCREALNLVKERRNCISPNKGFVAQLIEYEPIYQARRSMECGQISSEFHRNKRKSEHLSETVEVDLIQPPPSPCNGDNSDTCHEEMCNKITTDILHIKRSLWQLQKC